MVEKYNPVNEVVRVFIAKDEQDYIMYNWLFRAQWINPSADPRFIPLNLEVKEEDGYSWSFSKNYHSMKEFYEASFQDDKYLLVNHDEVLSEFIISYREINKASEKKDLQELINLIHSNKSKFSSLFLKIGDLGHSRNKEFDNYLENYHHFISEVDNLKYWVDNEALDDRQLLYQLNRALKRANKHYISIK